MGPAPPLNDRLFLAIVPPEELLQVVERGRPGTPMPAFAERNGGTLTPEQIRALAEGLPKRWLQAGRERGSLPTYAVGAGDAQRGAQLFERNCADCHPRGDAATLDNPAFLALFSDQSLRRIIITGRPDLGMPDYANGEGRSDDFRPLTSEEINDLVALLAAWRSGASLTSAESKP